MKKVRKFFAVLSVVTVLCLLGVMLPAMPVLAAESIELDPEEGEIGDRVDITGDGFDESDYDQSVYVEVDIYFTDEEVDDGDDIDDVDNYERVKSSADIDEDGELDTYFHVPDELTDGDDDVVVHGGTYYVFVTYDGDDNIEDVAEFTVIAAEITLDEDNGPVGTEVEIDGIDFFDDEDITVKYDGDEIDIESGDDQTDSSGEFTLTILIPESTAGEHTITVEDETGSEAEAIFEVEAEIILDPTSGAAGDKVKVNGTGFGSRNDVTIDFDGDEVIADETDEDGSFEVMFPIPVKSPDSYEVEAEDEENNKASADFDMAAGIKLGQTSGNVGTEVTISGTGFNPNATITITYAPESSPVATATADANGKFSATFEAPKSTGGSHNVTATDGSNTVSTTFTMETSAPPIPQPQLPLDGDKAKAMASFDWADVDDPSGVTYTLQIAASEDFTSSSMVLEKPDLADSEYTLTKEERLKSVKKEEPYYWRIQAVDGASNASGWTTPGSFYVGFSFELTGWVLYVLMAIAGIILALIGFLLGRRTSYM